MDIYAVDGDTVRYRSVEVMPGEAVPEYLANDELARTRAPTPCRLVESALPTGPFLPFLPTAFAVDPEACDALDSELLSICEMSSWPHLLRLEGRQMWAADVIEICNALDRKNTLWHEGREGDYFGICRFAFHPNRVSSFSGLFKLPVSEPCPIFAYSGPSMHGEGFMDAYHRAGAKGLRFTKVWSDEETLPV